MIGYPDKYIAHFPGMDAFLHKLTFVLLKTEN